MCLKHLKEGLRDSALSKAGLSASTGPGCYHGLITSSELTSFFLAHKSIPNQNFDCYIPTPTACAQQGEALGSFRPLSSSPLSSVVSHLYRRIPQTGLFMNNIDSPLRCLHLARPSQAPIAWRSPKRQSKSGSHTCHTNSLS